MPPTPYNCCLISLGANLGDPTAAIVQAAGRLRDELKAAPETFRLSPLFRTPPVGGPSGQPPFVNAVIALQTPLDPWESWSVVRKVEHDLGRVRQRRWEARMIDLDILLHGHKRIWTPQFKVPHPRMCMRRFILQPASKVAANWIDPVSGFTIGQLAAKLNASPSNLTLVATPASRPAKLLEETARIALAEWRTDLHSSSNAHSRWVQLVEVEDLQMPNIWIPPTKLIVLLTDPRSADGAQWEDVHAAEAVHWGFASGSSTPGSIGLAARYLLASDDPEWAVHEMAAAMDAMDCPVERIDDSHAM